MIFKLESIVKRFIMIFLIFQRRSAGFQRCGVHIQQRFLKSSRVMMLSSRSITPTTGHRRRLPWVGSRTTDSLASYPPQRIQHSRNRGVSSPFHATCRCMTSVEDANSYTTEGQIPQISYGGNKSSMETLVDPDGRAWKNYTEIMSEIMQRPRLQGKKVTAKERLAVQDYLLSNQLFLPPLPIPSAPTFHTLDLARNKTLLQQQLYTQRTQFLATTHWTFEAFEYCSRCIVYMGDMCARHGVAATIPWYKLRETGTSPRENSIATYLYALYQSGDVPSCLEAVTWHNSMFALHEKTVLLRIQALVQNNNVEQAEQLLQSLSEDPADDTAKRLRTFMPLLNHYCHSNDRKAVVRLYHDMRRARGVYLEAETYCRLLQTGAQHGWFRDTPQLFTQWATDLAEAHLEIDEQCVELLMNGFRQGGYLEGDDKNETSSSSDFYIGRVAVNNDATCPVTGSKLQLFALSPHKRVKAQRELFAMASTMREDFSLKVKQKFNRTTLPSNNLSGTQASKKLKLYTRWLRSRKGDAFTAFVDGPNVAYFGRGSVRWAQVLQVVEELEAMGETPLVIMPHKYVSASFRVSGSSEIQTLTEQDLEIVRGLNETGKMYTVSAGCFDDFYWMVSSVAQQNTTERPHYLPDNKDGRFPGMRPLLISNDQMRDHRWSMLEPRLFRRWTSCHIVNYYLNETTVSLIPAKAFSREMQSNPAPLLQGNTAWHFPVKEWRDPDRFCIAMMC